MPRIESSIEPNNQGTAAVSKLSVNSGKQRTLATSRRSFLGVLGAASGGFLLSAGETQAFIFGGRVPELDFSAMPSHWVRQQGTLLNSYASYLNGLRLKNMTVQQVIKAHARNKGSTWNVIPPRSMWRNMKNTLKVADAVSHRVGHTVNNIASAYRSPAYNRRCPGASPQSYHMRNNALDLQYRTSPRNVYAAAISLRQQGLYKGGVGSYRTFTHIDTRGVNTEW